MKSQASQITTEMQLLLQWSSSIIGGGTIQGDLGLVYDKTLKNETLQTRCAANHYCNNALISLFVK